MWSWIRAIGVAELVGVAVGGVVGAQVLDAAEVRLDDAQADGGEAGDERLRVLAEPAQDDQPVLREHVPRRGGHGAFWVADGQG